MHDLEIAALVFTLSMWKCYLHGEWFEIFTDDKSQVSKDSKGFKHAQVALGRISGAVQLRFDLPSGQKANLVANALSRHFQVTCMVLEYIELETLALFDVDFTTDMSVTYIGRFICNLLGWKR